MLNFSHCLVGPLIDFDFHYICFNGLRHTASNRTHKRSNRSTKELYEDETKLMKKQTTGPINEHPDVATGTEGNSRYCNGWEHRRSEYCKSAGYGKKRNW